MPNEIKNYTTPKSPIKYTKFMNIKGLWKPDKNTNQDINIAHTNRNKKCINIFFPFSVHLSRWCGVKGSAKD